MVTGRWFAYQICLSIMLLVAAVHSAYDRCVTNAKCGDCVRTLGCSWCLDSDWNATAPRCRPERLHTTCQDRYTVQSNHTSYAPPLPSIMSPERVVVNLRINDRHRIGITFTQPKDYPLDLYYLMDASFSMVDDAYNLASLGGRLREQISTITTDFRLGFGSFIDKALLPYTIYTDKQPYGFRNHLNLTTDSARFSEMVSALDMSGILSNVDIPEGGLDGLVQVMVCDNVIGWRAASRRLIIFATDAGFHMALDGKLAGLIQPNDGKCHLDADGFDTETLNQDYPSISQINQLAKAHSVNIIFAVTQSNRDVYDRLSGVIKGSTSATLNEDSSNIVELVVDQYKTIRSTVEMRDNASSFIDVAYYSKCNDGVLVRTNKCQQLVNETSVSFQVVFTAVECPSEPSDWQQIVQIYPVGFRKHAMVVVIDLICDCNCTSIEEKSTSVKCENRGVLKCGVCECKKEFGGRNCECSKTGDLSSSMLLDPQCQRANETILCSGRGTCVCGQCQCEARTNQLEQIDGTYCECDNFSCDNPNGKLCSGNGACKCGRCDCNPNFNGTSCDCSVSQDNCLADDGSICSGHGECVCNECVCDKQNSNEYSGVLCQHCPTCPGQCDHLRDCVLCQMYGHGPMVKSECDNQCTHIEFHPVTDLDDDGETDGVDRCVYYVDDCKFQFSYKKSHASHDLIVVNAQKRMDCGRTLFDILLILLGVVASIVLVGLATLVGWKLVTNIRDGREYERFVKESSVALWEDGENPLFRKPTSTFQNPIFRKSVQLEGDSSHGRW